MLKGSSNPHLKETVQILDVQSELQTEALLNQFAIQKFKDKDI